MEVSLDLAAFISSLLVPCIGVLTTSLPFPLIFSLFFSSLPSLFPCACSISFTCFHFCFLFSDLILVLNFPSPLSVSLFAMFLLILHLERRRGKKKKRKAGLFCYLLLAFLLGYFRRHVITESYPYPLKSRIFLGKSQL